MVKSEIKDILPKQNQNIFSNLEHHKILEKIRVSCIEVFRIKVIGRTIFVLSIKMRDRFLLVYKLRHSRNNCAIAPYPKDRNKINDILFTNARLACR